MDKLRGIIDRMLQFCRTDVWRIRMEQLPLIRNAAVKSIQVSLVSARGFRKYQCPLRASALTFYTVLSIVPVAAMAFGIASGFGFEKRLESELMKNFSGQEAVVSHVIEFAHSLLANTQGGLIAGVGVGVLFWAVIKVLGNIESSLNAIWDVEKGRSIGRKIGDYLGMMILAPVLVIVAGSATVFIKTQVTTITREVSILGAFSPMIFMGLKLLPYLLVWILFTVVYMVMPNTRVRIVPAVVAGVIAGTLYQLVQWGYINFQVGVAKNNAIYGSFAALPLFLVWLQLSWLIVLFGAVISSACQHIDQYAFDPDGRAASPALDRLLSLGIVRWIVGRFCDGSAPADVDDIAAALNLPAATVRDRTAVLVRAGILSRVQVDASSGGSPGAGDWENTALQPGRDVALLTVKSVADAVDHHGLDEIPTASMPAFEGLIDALSEMDRAAGASPANRLLKDIDGKKPAEAAETEG